MKKIGLPAIFRRKTGDAGGKGGKRLRGEIGHYNVPEAALMQVFGLVGAARAGDEDARLPGHVELVEVGLQGRGDAAGIPASAAGRGITRLPIGTIEGGGNRFHKGKVYTRPGRGRKKRYFYPRKGSRRPQLPLTLASFTFGARPMNPQQEFPEPQPKNNRILLWVALVLVLLGINGVLLYLNSQKKDRK